MVSVPAKKSESTVWMRFTWSNSLLGSDFSWGQRSGARVKGGRSLAEFEGAGALHLRLSLSRPLGHFAFLCPLPVHPSLCLSQPLFTLALFSFHLFISTVFVPLTLPASFCSVGIFIPYSVLYFSSQA